MNGFVSFFVTFLDLLTSFFYSAYRVIVSYWSDLILWILIFIGAVAFLRTFKIVKSRIRFLSTLREYTDEAGATLEIKRHPVLPLFFNLEGYDVIVKYKDNTYRIKFYPGFVGHRAIHVTGAKETHRLHKIMAMRAIEGKKLHGKKKILKYDNSQIENTVNILVFSPEPKLLSGISKTGGIWELGLEGNEAVDGVYLFPDELLLKQLTRVLEGFIDTVVQKH